MPSKTQRGLALFAVDAFVAIHKVKLYTKSFKSADELRFDSLHWDATIRELELIGEALNKLLEDGEFAKSAPRYFRKVVNFRNAISHGYFGIDEEEVWKVIKYQLEPLTKDLLESCANFINLKNAIDAQILEYKNLQDEHTVRFLASLLKNCQ